MGKKKTHYFLTGNFVLKPFEEFIGLTGSWLFQWTLPFFLMFWLGPVEPLTCFFIFCQFGLQFLASSLPAFLFIVPLTRCCFSVSIFQFFVFLGFLLCYSISIKTLAVIKSLLYTTHISQCIALFTKCVGVFHLFLLSLGQFFFCLQSVINPFQLLTLLFLSFIWRILRCTFYKMNFSPFI